MKLLNDTQFTRLVLFSNGLSHLFAAVVLFFPMFNLLLPGYGNWTCL